LEDLNAFLMGASRYESGKFLRYGSDADLQGIRFVITLDADTQLPKDTARRLVGTIAHPLNQPRIADDHERVTRGYSIIQPRVSTSLPSATSTGFSRLFSDPTGVDPYSMAVSDVYQDLSGESIYHGKGIYDVAALHLLLAGRFPCRHLLSHDLIEGAHVRTAFVPEGLPNLFPSTTPLDTR
jgi:cyclic beta-1,2-glucan synthetase